MMVVIVVIFGGGELEKRISKSVVETVMLPVS